MFKIIGINKKKLQLQDQIDLVDLSEVRNQDALPLDSADYDHEKSIYLFFRDLETSLLAGARLNPMTHKNLVSDTLQGKIKNCEQPSVWECSSLAFYMDPNHSLHEDPVAFKRVCHLYYQGLQEALITACVRFEIGLLVFLNFPNQIENMKIFGGMAFRHTIPMDNNLSLAIFQNPHRH